MKKLCFGFIFFLLASTSFAAPCDFSRAEVAVMTNDLPGLRTLDRECENLTSLSNVAGETLLHVATEFDSLSSMDYLLDLNANPNFQDGTGMTPLFFSQSVTAAKMLLNAGAKVRLEDRYGRTAFSKVLEDKNFPVMEYLLEEGARVRVLDITWAAEKYELEALQFLTENATKNEIAGSGKYFRTFFFNDKAYRQVADRLVELGADLNLAQTISSRRSLLDFHMDEYIKDERGYQENGISVLKWLAEHGADVNGYMPRMGRSIFQAMLTKKDFETNKKITEIFFENGLDINHSFEGNAHKTPLMEMGSVGDAAEDARYLKQMTTFLLQKGANPNMQSANGRTALHWAIRWSNLPVAKVLIPKTNLTLTDDQGLTALEYAKERLRRTPYTWEKKNLARIIQMLHM